MMSLKVLLIITIAKIEGKFVATRISDRNVIKTSFIASPDDIQWGHGYNSLKLQPTLNSPVEVKGLEESEQKCTKIQLKSCKTGGETFSFLAGDLFTAAEFLQPTSSNLNSFFQASQITDLSTVLVIKIDITTKASNIKSFRLAARAENLLKQSNYKEFTHFYGTHCLSKVIFGGYLYIALQFRSKTKREKEALDIRLSRLQEKYDSIAELNKVLGMLNEDTAMQINVFTVGSKQPPPTADISGIMSYAGKFLQNIEMGHDSKIHHVEYHSMFYIYGASFGFRQYAVPIQETVDVIVEISAAFQDTICRINSILELRSSDETFSYLSKNAIEKVRRMKEDAIDFQTDLKKRFHSLREQSLKTLIEEFTKIPGKIDNNLSDLLKSEKYFDASKKFYLRSRGLSRYVSIDKNHYPRLTDTSPIRLKFTHLEESSEKLVRYHEQFFLITSDTTPNYYLCMGKNNWYVFWDHHLNVDISKCSWNLNPAFYMTNAGDVVGFSDILLIYNKHWPEYVIGTTDDGRWLLTATKESAQTQARHQWIIEKTPF